VSFYLFGFRRKLIDFSFKSPKDVRSVSSWVNRIILQFDHNTAVTNEDFIVFDLHGRFCINRQFQNQLIVYLLLFYQPLSKIFNHKFSFELLQTLQFIFPS